MDNAYVTVYVLCYNSEKTIIETLDSIYRQTYNEIDLLISDDASRDSSVELIDNWLAAYSGRFRRVEVVKNKENRGINYTFDMCLKKCQNEWLKVIAADDMLLPTCIEKNVAYVKKHNNNSLLYSQDLFFTDDIRAAKRRGMYEQKYMEKIGRMSPEKQYKSLLRREIMYAPTAFINTNAYRLIGGISTKVRNIEDSALALSYTSSGYSINFMNEDTAYYRLAESVTRTKGKLYNKGHIEQIGILRKELIYPQMHWYNLLFWYDEMVIRFRYVIVIGLLKNRNNKFCRVVNNVLMGLSISSWKKFFLKSFYAVRYKGQ